MCSVILRGSKKKTYWRSYSVKLPEDVVNGSYGGGVLYFRREWSQNEDFFARLPNANIEDLNGKSIDSVIENCVSKGGGCGSVALPEGREKPKVLGGGRKLLPDNRYGAYY